MPSTYEPIQTITTSGNATTVNFSSIPNTYTDLVLIYKGGLNAFDYLYSRYNNDTNSNYSGLGLSGTGTGASSGRYTNGSFHQLIGWAIGQGSGLTNMGIVYFMNYSNTTTFKTIIVRDSNTQTSGGTQLGSHLWRSTSAINSISLTGINNRFLTDGSTLTLYGILKA